VFPFHFESPLAVGRLLMPVVFILAIPQTQTKLQAQETAIVSLKEFISTEVRAQGFTLPQATKVHVYGRGGGSGREDHWRNGTQMYAYGWILNATTREVVWQMAPGNTRRDSVYRVADQYLDLPKGNYEAYFTNHGFARNTMFSNWNSNIDRREIPREPGRRTTEPGFLSLLGLDRDSQTRIWKQRANNYGMELYVASAEAPHVQTFTAPLRWKNIFAATSTLGDSSHWEQAFEVKKPITLHVYAQGEGARGSMLHDYGWILDARSRKRVWEMNFDKAQYAGGAEKNIRQVETIQLPAGHYVATFLTDDSHSPADWNAAPPCDPLMYGLTLAVPNDAERAAVVMTEAKPTGPVLAELVRVRDDQNVNVSFTLKAPQAVHVYAIGEGVNNRMADYAWIEDASGSKVWTMDMKDTYHAGGARKNRLADLRLTLAKGTYTLHYRTDSSHAYGDWNSDAPTDTERYGATVRSITE